MAMSDHPPIFDVVEAAIIAALKASDEVGYIRERDGLHTLDGNFDLRATSEAVCAALSKYFRKRLEYDEEGVTMMLKGKKGSFELS